MDYPSSSSDNSFKRKCSVSCFVPKCPSNSIRFPKKLFLTVPNEPNLRDKWMKAARKQYLPSPKSVIRCCEDHFDMESDIENWIKFKLVGGKLILKKGVIPHIFDCQLKTQRPKPRSVVLKQKRQEILQSIENEQARKLKSLARLVTNEIMKNTDQRIQVAINPHKRSKEVQEAIKAPTNTITEQNISIKEEKFSIEEENISIKEENIFIEEENISIKEENIFTKEENIFTKEENENISTKEENIFINEENISIKEENTDQHIQSGINPHIRSKEVQEAIKAPTNTITDSKQKLVMKHQMTSPLVTNELNISIKEENTDMEEENLTFQFTISNIKRESEFYIGVPNDSRVILKLI